MRRIVLPVLVALAAVGVAAPPAASATVDQVPWGACSPDFATTYPHLKCASLRVPLDYTKPNGTTISLALVKAPARDAAKRRGVLFVNNGGPGASPLAFVGNLT